MGANGLANLKMHQPIVAAGATSVAQKRNVGDIF